MAGFWVTISLSLMLAAVGTQAIGYCDPKIIEHISCSHADLFPKLHDLSPWVHKYLTRTEAGIYSCIQGCSDVPCGNISSLYYNTEYVDPEVCPDTREFLIKDVGCGHFVKFGFTEGIRYDHYIVNVYGLKVVGSYICSDHLPKSGKKCRMN